MPVSHPTPTNLQLAFWSPALYFSSKLSWLPCPNSYPLVAGKAGISVQRTGMEEKETGIHRNYLTAKMTIQAQLEGGGTGVLV